MSAKLHRRDRLLRAAIFIVLVGGVTGQVLAQRPVHTIYRSNFPPGAIGALQLARDPARRGYLQPVEVIVPSGAIVGVAAEGVFQYDTTRLRAGFLVGSPYRLRITNIPRHEDRVVYPSLEVIDRLRPPAGQKDRFPIPVEVSQEDLELALSGSMVVRVIYLENPLDAFPKPEGDEQRYLNVLPAEDPLEVADQLGRPMAILRLGSRIPTEAEIDSAFLFGSPPVEWIDPIQADSTTTETWPTDPVPFESPSTQDLPSEPSDTMTPEVQKRRTGAEFPSLPGPELDNPFLDDSELE